MIGGDVQRRSMDVLLPGGRIVTIVPNTKDAEGVRNDVTVLRPIVNRDHAHLERIAGLLLSGAVHALEVTRMPLSAVRKAHELAESRQINGKIALKAR
jgi:NADPH:quinone reductase-like Zn-dependent oxidoreductase